MDGDRPQQASALELTKLLPIVLGQQLAACLLFAAESVELWRVDSSGFMAAARQSFVIMAAGGSVLGMLVAGVEAARRLIAARTRTSRGRIFTSAPVAYALLALAPFFWLGTALFSGAWISTQPYAPVGPPLIALIGAAGVAVAVGSVAFLSAISIGLASAALVSLGSVLALLDRYIARDLYGFLHVALMVLSALALGSALRLIIEPIIGWPRRRAALALIPTAALSFSLVLVFTHGPNVGHRRFWDSRPSYGGRLYEGASKAIFMLRTRSVDRGVYGEDVAVWAADQKGLRSAEENLRAWEARIAEARSAAAQVKRPVADGIKPHLLMITVDALRADVAYEALQGSLAPLAQAGVVFRRAYASSPSTRKSLPVLLSGRTNWRSQEQTIFSALAAGGYDTVFVADGPAAGWLQSHDQRWVDQPHSTLRADRDKEGWSSEQITRLAQKRIAEQPSGKPLFLWAHYFDVHEWKKLEQDVRGGDAPSGYRRAWARVQSQIAELVQAAQATLGADRVAIVFAADHGEYLGEMGRMFHGRWIAPELMQVPLVLAVPGQPPGEVLGAVGLIDVAPTLALLAGTKLPEADGIPLTTADAAARARRPLALGAPSELGVVVGAHRLVLDPSRNLVTLYDDSQGARPLRTDAQRPLQSELISLLLGSPVAREDRSVAGVE